MIRDQKGNKAYVVRANTSSKRRRERFVRPREEFHGAQIQAGRLLFRRQPPDQVEPGGVAEKSPLSLARAQKCANPLSRDARPRNDKTQHGHSRGGRWRSMQHRTDRGDACSTTKSQGREPAGSPPSGSHLPKQSGAVGDRCLSGRGRASIRPQKLSQTCVVHDGDAGRSLEKGRAQFKGGETDVVNRAGDDDFQVSTLRLAQNPRADPELLEKPGQRRVGRTAGNIEDLPCHLGYRVGVQQAWTSAT